MRNVDMSEKVIVSWEHKHGTDYFRGTRDAIARNIFAELIDIGYVYAPEETEFIVGQRVNAAITDEELDALPGDYSVKAQVEKDRKNAQRYVKQHEEDIAEWNEIQRALSGEDSLYEKDGRARSLAWDLLMVRSGSEYERYEVVRIKEVE